MNSNLRMPTPASTLAITLMLSAGVGQRLFGETITMPPVPPNIQVPSGNVAFFKSQAVGTQNYICSPAGEGFAWKLFGPQATLFVTIRWVNGDIRQQVMTHFLSANPAENGTARPTWQSSIDTSAIWGKAIAQSSDPNYVEAGAIPWLLLEVVGAQRGPAGGDLMTPTTYIQRVRTSGGVAPSTGCSQATVSSTMLAPYTTDYIFYRASRR
jgi:hypothetical protein